MNKAGTVKEKPWFNEKIRFEIGLRKQMNRKHRNADPKEKEELFLVYLTQKRKVKSLIREEILKYESRVTDEIRASKDGRKLWKNIRKLKGIEEKDREEKLYD